MFDCALDLLALVQLAVQDLLRQLGQFVVGCESQSDNLSGR